MSPLSLSSAASDVYNRQLDTLGESITIVMPYYQVLAEQLNLPTVTEQQTLFTEGQVYHFDIRYMQWHGIPIYFVDSPEYFMREGLYANAFEAYEDNGERFSFFSGAVLQTLKAIDKKPDIIHCHDWHAAMLPFLLTHDKSGYFDGTKTIFTIHNAAFQGVHKLRAFPFFAIIQTFWRKFTAVTSICVKAGLSFPRK